MLGFTDFNIDFLTESPLVTSLLFIFLVLISIYLYRNTNPPISRKIKTFLTILRITAVLALFLTLYEPVASFTREYTRKPVISLLYDRSKSMDTVDKSKSRRELADSLLSSISFQDFIENFDLRQYIFAATISEFGSSINVNKTALGNCMAELSRREIGSPSDYWLLLSDGINNSGTSPIDIVSGIKTPIYSIGFGELTDTRDILITGLEYNDVIFAGKPTELTVSLEWAGMINEQARISIKSSGKTLQSKTISLPPGNLRDNIKLKFIPEKIGRQTLEISVSDIPNELSQKNNRRLFSVLVLKSKLNVLLVSDKLDWEYAFLKRFLIKSESIELTPVLYKENGEYLTGRFPSQQKELNRFDLIILYDIKDNILKSRAELIESFLNDHGGGLLVLLGDNYLEKSFPRAIDNFLPFISTKRNAEIIYCTFNGRPDENYLYHPAVRISDNRGSIRQAWSSLPNFEILIPLDSITPNSEIYVTADIDNLGDGFPILGFRNFGPGKVMATSAAPFWHWAFFGYGFGEDAREYRLLFDGIINWLSFHEDSDPIRIVPDKNIFTRGEKIGFNALVYDLGFRPITGATGNITLVDEARDTTVIQLIESKKGKYRAEIDLLPPGKYDYTGLIEKDGRILKETKSRIAVESFSIEEYRRKPEFGALSAISQKTGGQFFALDNVDSLYDRLNTDLILESKKTEIVLWNKFWLLAIFILALGIEWLLRKKYQLI
ncbi:MAG TPA: hypothetical protein ENL22_08970 [candidate division Zixibacteria bacterium]|nr:hypothetical protein [candidate division Zixibacteria bacterium]